MTKNSKSAPKKGTEKSKPEKTDKKSEKADKAAAEKKSKEKSDTDKKAASDENKKNMTLDLMIERLAGRFGMNETQENAIRDMFASDVVTIEVQAITGVLEIDHTDNMEMISALCKRVARKGQIIK